MPRLLSSVLWVLSYLSVGYLMVTSVRAAEYVITPSVKLRETYDDNVFFRDIDDFEHLMSPGLKLDGRTEQATWQASGGWDISKYQDHDELDTVDQTYRLSASAQSTPLLELNIAGHYLKDDTFASTLEESGLVAERSRRSSATVQPGAAVALDERNTLQFAYEFNKTRYETKDYPDYRVHGLNLSWFHDLLDERTHIIFVVSGNQADFKLSERDVKQRTYRALAGVDHQLAETLQFRFTAGAWYTESEFPRTKIVMVAPGVIAKSTTTEKEHDTGFMMDGSLNWSLELITLSASVNRDIAPSIYGENITRDRFSAALKYRLSEQVSCDLSAAYYHSETAGVVRDEKWQTYSIRPGLAYKFTENMNLQLGCAYTWTENEITDHSEHRNRFFVQLTTAWPRTID